MTVALGASAYEIAIFHLGTHAFFKALLFLAAGSVIIAMHHEQDMRKMGGLRAIMPITYLTCLAGSLALAGIPPFAGFFSKDAIIEAVHHSQTAGAQYAYIAVLTGVFITAFYSFRLLFMTFHGRNRSDAHTRLNLHESPAVVTLPLVALAIPSILAGLIFFGPVISGEHFGNSLFTLGSHDVTQEIAEGYNGRTGIILILSAILHGMLTLPFWLAVGGITSAWYCYCRNPALPARIATTAGPVYRILQNKYGFDNFYQALFAKGSVMSGKLLYKYVDAGLIDGALVNGTANTVAAISVALRKIQTGYTYHYAFVMIIGLFSLITLFIWF